MKKLISIFLVILILATQMFFTAFSDTDKEEITFQTLCEADFSKYSTTSEYTIEKDSSGIAVSSEPVRIGTTDIYLYPPASGVSLFATPEVGQIDGGKLKLKVGKAAKYDAYTNRECRFKWQPEGYDKVGDTYRLTVDGKNANSNSGFIMRFHTDNDASNCYMLVVPSCNRDGKIPGWFLYKRTESLGDIVLMQSSQITAQATTGDGYLKTFTAEITVTDKKNITVHMVGESNTNKAVDETVSYTDEEPFEHSMSDNHIHMVPYGGSGYTEINSIKLETVASPKTSSYILRKGDKYTIKTKFDFCEEGTTYVCGYKDGVLKDSVSRPYTKDSEDFELNGDFDILKVFMWDEDLKPLTKPEELKSPEKNLYTVIAKADFSEQTAENKTYAIEKDSSDYPMYNTDVQIGTTDFYLMPPNDQTGKVFTGGVDEKATLIKGALQLKGGYSTLGGYSNRECRTEWRPENYSSITNTYRITIDAQNDNANSGSTFRFQVNDQKDAYYQFAVYSCSKSKDKPAWEIVKYTEDGNSSVLMGSEVMPTQSTTGEGYLKKYKASITVIDKKTIYVDITGTTSASKAFKESKVYVDENPFAQNANEQYMHFKSYGAATSTASIYSVTLESDLNASAVGEPAEPIDYGTVETAETNKFTWKPYDKGYMTIVYDDNNDNLEGMFNVTTKEYGFPICAAVPTKYIDRNPISLLEEIQASGGEILSHTASHPQLNFGTPWTTVEEEFKKSYDILTERGFNVNGIILSGGTNSDTSTAYGRAIEPITAKYYKYSDRYGVSPQFNKPRDSFSGMSAQQIKNIIDRMIRNKDWIVIYAHNFSEFPEAIMREVFDYAKQKQDEGVFDIVTYKYIYQNFAEFENPVDFGRDTFNVNFYGTDNKTLLGTSSVYDGDDATAPEGYVVKEGYTFSRWSQPIENVTENMNVYAICTDNATGLEIDTSHENVMVKSFDTANPVLANTKKKILSDNSLKISYLNSSSSSKAFDTTVADWLDMQFSGISVTSDNYGIIGATTALGTYAFDELYNSGNASDLVFIDYTANDTASYPTNNVWSKADIKRQAEYLVRNIYNVNPNADIVFVLDNKGDASGSYEAYMELAEEYKATGIGCLDLDGVETSDYEEKITGFLKSYLVDVYILGGELDDHESVMPAEYLSRSPWVNGRLIEASSFTTEVSNAGSAISARMVDSAVSKIELAPSSVVFSSGDKASFTFDGTGFGMVMDGVADEASVKYQIDGHGWKTMTIPENDGGIVVTFENELSYTSHEIELEFTTETMVGGAYVFGEDNGLLNITALSIDDGPKEASTGLILDVLKKYGAHATFFSIGINVKNAQGIVDTSKALLNRVLAEGSEIGNHSNSTALPDTKEGIQNHFEMAQEKIFEATGTYPVVYRSPGNDHSDAVFEAVTLPLMNGYNIGSDWNGPDAGGPSVESRINSITKNAEDGNIILIHDNVWNAEALETALPNIAAKGLKVVTVSELIRLRGYEVPAMRQYRAFWKSGWEIFAQHSSLSE